MTFHQINCNNYHLNNKPDYYLVNFLRKINANNHVVMIMVEKVIIIVMRGIVIVMEDINIRGMIIVIRVMGMKVTIMEVMEVMVIKVQDQEVENLQRTMV